MRCRITKWATAKLQDHIKYPKSNSRAYMFEYVHTQNSIMLYGIYWYVTILDCTFIINPIIFPTKFLNCDEFQGWNAKYTNSVGSTREGFISAWSSPERSLNNTNKNLVFHGQNNEFTTCVAFEQHPVYLYCCKAFVYVLSISRIG